MSRFVRNLVLCWAAVFVASCGAAQPATSSAAPSATSNASYSGPRFSVVAVNVETVLTVSVPAKQADGRIQALHATLQAELRALRSAVTQAEQAHDPRAKQLFDDLETRLKQMEEEYLRARQQELEGLLTLVSQAVNRIATQSQIDVVVETDSVLYRGVTLADITDAVVAELDPDFAGQKPPIPAQAKIAIGYVDAAPGERQAAFREAKQRGSDTSVVSAPHADLKAERAKLSPAAARVAQQRSFQLVVDNWIFKRSELPDLTRPVFEELSH